MAETITGLIGNPLGHSLSPEIHSRFGNTGYRLFPMEKEQVGPFLKKKEFTGLNVTIPYKETVIPFLDRLSPLAKRIGSVNTIVNRNGVLYGDNTDYEGFASLLRRSRIYIKGKKVLVLGSGGASRTVRFVLSDFGAREIVVISRSGENNYENLHLHKDAQVIVNTTPVGMFPNVDGIPLHPADFPMLDGVVDLIYNPLRTRLIQEAQDCGIPCASGMHMLVTQAAKAHALFFGEKIPYRKLESITREMTLAQANILLVGMPGCGKTSIGHRLIQCLSRPFVDTDQLAESLAGKSAAEVIRQEGIAAFRKIETEALRSVAAKSGQIISSGGGIVVTPENLPYLRMNSVVFFLNRPLSSLSTYNRPLSSSPEALEKLFAERLPLYRSVCDFEIEDARAPALFFGTTPKKIARTFGRFTF